MVWLVPAARGADTLLLSLLIPMKKLRLLLALLAASLVCAGLPAATLAEAQTAADTALATRHAEAWYVATVLATAATSWALLTIARALTTATKETP